MPPSVSCWASGWRSEPRGWGTPPVRTATISLHAVTERNAAFASTLVHALHRLGVDHACVSPGSRSTPLALAVIESPITAWSHHDERSSAFFALGIARVTGRPVVVITTSGTAAAELHPALAEARAARVPLIAITADRPTELHDVGAPQTIDQRGLFGPTVKWSHDTGVPDPALVPSGHAAALAAHLVAEAGDPPAGPVHLNLRFREPLMGSAPASEVLVPEILRPRVRPDPETVSRLTDLVSDRRGLLIAGPDDDPQAPAAAAACATALGWPLVADPLSGARCGEHDLSRVLAASDALGWAGFLDRASPEVVIRFGAIPTSKPAWQWLADHPEVPQVLIDPAGWRDPGGSARLVVRADPAATLRSLAEAAPAPAGSDWWGRWAVADGAAADALHSTIDAAGFPTEPAVARTVEAALPSGAMLWVASSMPIRDLDAVMRPSPRPLRVMANRGANGIDGFVSTALGAAAAAGHAVAIAGDLSVLHDATALASAARLGIPLKVVVINNDGGGIFHMLPQVGHPHFERFWGTPHGLDLTSLAEAFGVDAETVDHAGRLAESVAAHSDRPRLIQVHTDRSANADLHRQIRQAVAAAVDGL